jgi:hypothetical protein
MYFAESKRQMNTELLDKASDNSIFRETEWGSSFLYMIQAEILN